LRLNFSGTVRDLRENASEGTHLMSNEEFMTSITIIIGDVGPATFLQANIPVDFRIFRVPDQGASPGDAAESPSLFAFTFVSAAFCAAGSAEMDAICQNDPSTSALHFTCQAQGALVLMKDHDAQDIRHICHGPINLIVLLRSVRFVLYP